MSISTSDAICCDRCGSGSYRRFGFKLLSLRKVQQYQCKACGKLFCAANDEGEPIPCPAQSRALHSDQSQSAGRK